MKKLSVVLSAALLTMGSASAAIVNIDTFSNTQTVTAAGPAPISNNGGILAAGAIGGARNIAVQITNGNGTATANVNNAGSDKLEYSLTSGENGTFTLIYDGGTDNTVNTIGLGSIDLTDGGLNDGLLINLSSDLIAPITITIFQGADSSSAQFNTPGGNAPTNVQVSFASFVGTASASNVGAIRITVDGTAIPGTTGLDGSFDFITTYDNDVPEPASMMMIGGGLSALALFLRRRKTA